MANYMKKIFLLGAVVCTIGMMAACKGGAENEHTADGSDGFEEAKVIVGATFGPEDTPNSIEAKIKATKLPVRIDWDCNGKAWLSADCDSYTNILFLPVVDSIDYICKIAQVIFNDEQWLCITYTEDVTGQYWQWMSPRSECGVFYKTDLISPQGEPYQMASRGVKAHGEDSNQGAIVVRYIESGTLDTIPLVKHDNGDNQFRDKQ